MESLELLYFTADWCQPCKVFGPRLTGVAKDLDVTLVKIDADEQGDLVEEFIVMSLPTVIIMKNGAESERWVGAKTEEYIRKGLQTHKGS